MNFSTELFNRSFPPIDVKRQGKLLLFSPVDKNFNLFPHSVRRGPISDIYRHSNYVKGNITISQILRETKK